MFETVRAIPISIPERFELHEAKMKMYKSKEKLTSSLTESYKQIVNDLEQTKPSNINIINIAKQYGVQHHRVYDLFNLLTSLGVCQNIERGKLAWIGLSSISSIVSKVYTNSI